MVAVWPVLALMVLSLATGGLACYCEKFPWTQWSACTVTCGGGRTSRRRLFTMDEYFHKFSCGTVCSPGQESSACNLAGCSTPCSIGDWSAWSPCDPCVRKQFRYRKLVTPAQFGGRCEDSAMTDDRPCLPTAFCNIQQTDCVNKFRCQNGRCIPRELQCSGEHDCGDGSDEEGCPKREPPCPRMVKQVPGAQLIGSGYNALAGELAGEVLNNTYFGDKTCKTISGDTIGKIYRLSSNLYNITLEVTNLEDDVTDEFYPDAVNYESNVHKPSDSYSDSTSGFNIPILFGHSKSRTARRKSSFKEVIQASTKKDSAFVRVHKKIAVSKFTMKDTDLHASEPFLMAMSSLPVEYNYAVYSQIFQDFGTHYFSSGTTGGVYDLLYQYDRKAIESSGLTQSELSECVTTETVTRVLFIKIRKKSRRCTHNSMTMSTKGSILEASEKSVSMVRGGRAEFAAALAWQKGKPFPGENKYEEWVKSVRDNPTVVDFKLRPIVGLVKGIPCAVTKRRNLEQAMMDYMEIFDPCQCRPCPNNGKAVMVENSCLCICKAGTYGDSCEHRLPHFNSEVQDGYWSCWSAWSSCSASHRRRRTRLCNNPAPSDGGNPCEGPASQQQTCRFALFSDQTTLCINDDEERREVDPVPSEPTDGTLHCPKPEPPDNGFFRVSKPRYEVAELLEVRCFTGYAATGYQFYRCLPDGTWHKEEMECERTVCTRPPITSPARLQPLSVEYSVGESVQVRCPAGMAPATHPHYTCGVGLTWEPEIHGPIACQHTISTHGCSPGQKWKGSECVCRSPEQDCGSAQAVGLCAFDVAAGSVVNISQCAYLAARCEGQELQLVTEGQCGETHLPWAAQRAQLLALSSRREPCGHLDACGEWEQCTDSVCQCYLPNQCSRDVPAHHCVILGSQQKSVSLCLLGALKCRGVPHRACGPTPPP